MNLMTEYSDRRVTRSIRKMLDTRETADVERAIALSLPVDEEDTRLVRPRVPFEDGSSDSSGSTASTSSDVRRVVTSRDHRRAFSGPSPPRAPVAQTARGIIYATGQRASRRAIFKLKDDQHLPFGKKRMIPEVHVEAEFDVPHNTPIHRSFITINEKTFLVYGFTTPTYPPNLLVRSLKSTTTWRGDIIVFSVGTMAHRPLLLSPTTRRDVINIVVSVFVSCVTEALDLHVRVPMFVEAGDYNELDGLI